MKMRRQTESRTKRTIFHQRGEIFLERLLSGFNLFNYRCIQCNCRSLHRYFILYMYIPYIRVENAGSFSSAPPTVTISIRVHLLLFCVTVTILMRSSVEDEIDFRYPIVLGRFFLKSIHSALVEICAYTRWNCTEPSANKMEGRRDPRHSIS